MKKIGFIGTGYMGGALALAASRSEMETRLILANRSKEKAEKLARQIGATVSDNKTVAKEAYYIFLGVKPQILPAVAEEIVPILKERKDRYVIVSMIAGKDIPVLEGLFGTVPIIRIMPNMPVTVGSGLSFYCFSDNVSDKEKEFFLKLMAPTGVLHESNEHYMAALDGVSGCGPAFAAMFLEALADGAVACGVSRKDAYTYAAQMLKGTADLYLESCQHPGAIKDSVCSPAGLTIEGVRVLEQRAFRSAVIDALVATFEKRFQ